MSSTNGLCLDGDVRLRAAVPTTDYEVTGRPDQHGYSYRHNYYCKRGGLKPIPGSYREQKTKPPKDETESKKNDYAEAQMADGVTTTGSSTDSMKTDVLAKNMENSSMSTDGHPSSTRVAISRITIAPALCPLSL